MIPVNRSNTFLSPQHVLEQVALAPGMAVADFGSGTGDFVLIASKIVGADGQVTAIDVQESAISSVRSRARIAGLLNITPVRANLEVPHASTLADDSQDVILLTNILFQNQKKDEIIQEAHRTLKPGGIVMFIDWQKEAALGPMRGYRMDKEEVVKLFASDRFTFTKEIEAGAYHFGILFSKQSKS